MSRGYSGGDPYSPDPGEGVDRWAGVDESPVSDRGRPDLGGTAEGRADPRTGARRWVAGTSSGPLLHRRRPSEFPHSSLAAWESVVARARAERDPDRSGAAPSTTAVRPSSSPPVGGQTAAARPGAARYPAARPGAARYPAARPGAARYPAGRPVTGGPAFRRAPGGRHVRRLPAEAGEELGHGGEGVESNARLTGMTAVVLLVLLAIEGLTILRIGPLLTAHVVIGMLLVPPVLLKIGSTTWRFGRYYLGSPAYRRKGPPPPLLRLLGPLVVVLTVAVLGTGIALLLGPPGTRNTLLLLHKASFVLWFGAMAIHVLGHIVETTRLAPRDFYRRTRRQVRGASARQWALAATLGIGLLLGVALAPRVGPWLVGTGAGGTPASHRVGAPRAERAPLTASARSLAPSSSKRSS
jgi:hypothetical protein